MNTAERIIQLEKKYWQAMKDADIETAISLTRFPCVVNNPEGTRFITEDEYRSMMRKNSSKNFEDIEVENPRVEVMGNKAAIISYEIDVNGMKMSDTSTWIMEGNNWVCAFHSENPIRS